MPNWAYNNLTVYGQKDLVMAFKSQVTTSDNEVDLTTLVPMPKILEGTTSPEVQWRDLAWVVRSFREGKVSADRVAEDAVRILNGIEVADKCIQETGHANWYDWCCAHWGTKWAPSGYNVSDPIEVDGNITWSMYFETAWCSPVNLFNHIARLYPDLVFVIRITEESCAFTGALGWHGTDFVEKTYNIWQDVPKRARTLQIAMKAIASDTRDEDCYSVLWDKQSELEELVCDLAQEEVLSELATYVG